MDRVHQVGGPGVGVLGLTCRGAPATGWLTAIHSGVLKRNVRTTHYFRPPTLDTLLPPLEIFWQNNRSSA